MNRDIQNANMASIARKSPTITISHSDFDPQPPSRSWWKRTMYRRSRNLLFLITLVALGYFITGSKSRQSLQQQYLDPNSDYRPQIDSLPRSEVDDVTPSESSPSPIPSTYLADAVAAVRPSPESTEVYNNADDNVLNGTIGMVTMLYGDPNPVYERALESHVNHGKRHGYPVYVLRQKLLGRLWSKPAYLLSIILEELQKPKEIRLKWLFWFDADTVLINPKIPLELFVPPSPEFDHIHFLCGDDHHGLNDGAFLLRINDYSLHLMAAALTVESFRPEVNLRFSEQSAIEHVVASEDLVRPWESFSYTDGYAKIPQRWMNAYMGPRTEDGVVKPRKQIKGNSVKEGDMLVHFAGSGETKRRRMSIFMDAWELHREQWEIEPENTDYAAEISTFWKEWKMVEEKRHKAIEEAIEKFEAEEASMVGESSATAAEPTQKKTVVETPSPNAEKSKHHSGSSKEKHKAKHHSESAALHTNTADTVLVTDEQDHEPVADHDVEGDGHSHNTVSDDTESSEGASSFPSDDVAVAPALSDTELSSAMEVTTVTEGSSPPDVTKTQRRRREMLAGKIRREETALDRRTEAAPPPALPPSLTSAENELPKRDARPGKTLDKSKIMRRRVKRTL